MSLKSEFEKMDTLSYSLKQGKIMGLFTVRKI